MSDAPKTDRHEMERLLASMRSELQGKAEEVEGLAQQLDELQQQLFYHQKLAVLGSLVAGIAHEIKTPIGAISSMQDTLNRAVDKLVKSLDAACPEHRENRGVAAALRILDDAKRVIGSGSERTLQIVRRVQKFARLDALQLEPCDLHAELDDTVLLLHHQLKNRVTVEKRYGDIPQITCNIGQINQVLLNVLVNAGQAIEDRGTITISTWAEPGEVAVSVKDTGCGIPEEHLKRIFSPGFTTKTKKGGTGLGLAISAQIVEQHRGRIEMKSTVGEGTEVIIHLADDLKKDE